MRSSSVVMILGLVAVAAACQSMTEDTGVVKLAIASGPPDAACLRVTVSGSAGAATVRTLALTPGMSTTGTLAGLPVGSVNIEAEAFNSACSAITASSVATWAADPVTVVLTAGTPVSVQLEMERAGQIKISVDWNNGLLGVASVLNGQMLLAPCVADTAVSVCADHSGTCPNQTATDLALRGVLLTDKTLTLGGTAGTSYTVTLHVQGEVEAKQYGPTAMDQEGMLGSPMADGFATGGVPTTANAYGVYMIRVTNPGATTSTDYFLNSLTPPGVSNHTTYGVDYVATIKAQGGATVRLVASDSNCSEIKNCGPMANDGSSCAGPIVMTNIEPSARSLNPSFNFDTAYNGQWLVMTVTNVTSP
jgi:hypothetical protein